MTYSTWTRVLLASVLSEVDAELRCLMEPVVRKIVKIVVAFLRCEVSPTSSLRFEEELQQVLQELGRIVTEWAYNHVEPNDPQSLPRDVHVEGSGYRRLNQKTPNRNVATRFGKITLWRFGYRDWQREGGGPVLFPLERTLGLVGGATPALASAAGRYLAEAGATQEGVLKRLRRELHAAAARASRQGVIRHRKRDYRRAYEYLRTRAKFMQYWEYRRHHLPIGSGVTEAACKTVFTQRLKLSGMRWKHEGARTVLTLRVILLSGIVLVQRELESLAL